MRKLLTCMCAVFMFGIMSVGVHADSSNPNSVKVEQSVVVTDEKPTDEIEGFYEITAVDSSTPAFETAEVKIKGDGEAEFVLPSYTTPGDYEYVIENKTESKDDYTLQNHVYYLTVRVMYAPNSDVLERSYWVTKDDETAKSAEVKYECTYTRKPASTPAPSAKPTTTSKPTSTVTVFKNVNTGDADLTIAKVALVTSIVAVVFALGLIAKRVKDSVVIVKEDENDEDE